MGSEKITKIYRNIPTKEVENYTKQYNEPSHLKCVHFCSKCPSCKVFNQQQNKEVCQLDDKIIHDENRLTISEGWVYFEQITVPNNAREPQREKLKVPVIFFNKDTRDSLIYNVEINTREVTICFSSKLTAASDDNSRFWTLFQTYIHGVTCLSGSISLVIDGNNLRRLRINEDDEKLPNSFAFHPNAGNQLIVYSNGLVISFTNYRIPSTGVSFTNLALGNTIFAHRHSRECITRKRSFVGYIYRFDVFSKAFMTNDIECLIESNYRDVTPSSCHKVEWNELIESTNPTEEIEVFDILLPN